MVKRRKNRGSRSGVKSTTRTSSVVSNSDPEPDSKSSKYYDNEIDEFHNNRDTISLSKYEKDDESDISSEEEVLGLDLMESEESDDEKVVGYKRNLRQIRETVRKYKKADEANKQSDANENKGWGKKKSHYYGSDINDRKTYALAEEDDGEYNAALQEEREALELQKKLIEQLDESDFGLETLTVDKGSIEDTGEKIETDISKLSLKERQELFKKKSPEFSQLRNDFIEKLSMVNDLFLPAKSLIKEGYLDEHQDSKYINVCMELYLNYCININFYMALIAKNVHVQTHPVIKQILRYKKMITVLEDMYSESNDKLKLILVKHSKGELRPVAASKPVDGNKSSRIEITKAVNSDELSKLRKNSRESQVSSKLHRENKKQKEARTQQLETSGEREASHYYEMIRSRRRTNEDHGLLFDESEDGASEISCHTMESETGDQLVNSSEAKRAITYQIAKNKGLAAKRRKKLLGNPRVKHRLKYKKALSKRRTVVKEAQLPLGPYGGEMMGIRAGLKRSIALQ